MDHAQTFIPGARLHLLTPVYDRLFSLFLPARELRDGVVERLDLPRGARVLDLACGTGALLGRFAALRPDLDLLGLDIDPAMIARAGERSRRAGARVKLITANADRVPLPDASLDAVVSVLAFHHLPPPIKRGAAAEIRRLLKPGGSVLIADFGPPLDRVQAALFAVAGRLESAVTTAGHADGVVGVLLREQGFDVAETGRMRTIFGSVAFYQATA